MSSSSAKSLGALAALLLLSMAACEFVTDNEFATLTIQLTDAADQEVTQAWVTITDIYLQPDPGETDPPGGRVYVLKDAEETHELLSLADDEVFLAVDVDIPAGTYEQLRLVITEGCIVVSEGEARTVYSSSPDYDPCPERDGTLQMPSYGQSGAKIPLNGLELTGDQGILLDFNVPESFGHQAGNSGKWILHPVIDWVEVDLTAGDLTAGVDVSLSPGDVELPLPGNLGLKDFSVTLSPFSGDPKSMDFTDSDGDGIFEASFRHLDPDTGPFDIELIHPPALIIELTSGSDPPSTPVEPGSGETAAVHWVLKSAMPGGGS